MSVVYLAEDAKMQGRQVALKELRLPEGSSEQEVLEAEAWFAREAALLSSLHHPLVPVFYSVFREAGRSYIAQEYVPGENLDDVVRRQGPVAVGSAVTWAISMCQLLEYLHHLPTPVVFRDLKPANILLRAAWNSADRRLAVVDFGIARTFQHDTVGTVIGTPGYAPPEQYQGLASPQSDIYSLGMTLHRLLTGYDPEQGAPFNAPLVRSLRPEVSEALAYVVRRATSLSPSDRFGDAGEMGDALRSVLPSSPYNFAQPSAVARTAQRVMMVIAAVLLAPLVLTQIMQHLSLSDSRYADGDMYAPSAMQYTRSSIPASGFDGPTIGARPQQILPAGPCGLPKSAWLRPRPDITCAADGSTWYLDQNDGVVIRVQPDGLEQPFAIAAHDGTITTLTAGPGGKQGADVVWLSGSSSTVMAFSASGLESVVDLTGSGAVVPLGTLPDGSLLVQRPTMSSRTYAVSPSGALTQASAVISNTETTAAAGSPPAPKS